REIGETKQPPRFADFKQDQFVPAALVSLLRAELRPLGRALPYVESKSVEQNTEPALIAEAIGCYLDAIIDVSSRTNQYLFTGDAPQRLPDVRTRVTIRNDPLKREDLLALAEEQARYNSRSDPRFDSTDTLCDWDIFFKGVRRCLVLGDPGFGKTWLIRHEALSAAQDAKSTLDGNGELKGLPFSVQLPRVAKHLEKKRANEALAVDSATNVKAAAFSHSVVDTILDQYGIDSDPLRNALIKSMQRRESIVLLDSWDEIRMEEIILLDSCFRSWVQQTTGLPKLLITSRKLNAPEVPWEPSTLDGSDQIVELAPFAPDQVREFATRYFRNDELAEQLADQLLSSQHLSGPVRVPVVLALACRYVSKIRSSTGRFDLSNVTRVTLYESVVEELLRGIHRADQEQYTPLNLDQVGCLRWLVAFAAYRFLLSDRRYFGLSEVSSVVNDWLKSPSEGTLLGQPDGFRSQLSIEQWRELLAPANRCESNRGNGGFLSNVGDFGGEFEFPHLTIQEYLAASYLDSQTNFETVLAAVEWHWDSPSWQIVWDFLGMCLCVRKERTDTYKIDAKEATRRVELVLLAVHENQHALDRHLHRNLFFSIRFICFSKAYKKKLPQEEISSPFSLVQSVINEVCRYLRKQGRTGLDIMIHGLIPITDAVEFPESLQAALIRWLRRLRAGSLTAERALVLNQATLD
ncbi:MAG: hypothetical protein AAFX06_31820, partial [Planctomycetota bacterium]